VKNGTDYLSGSVLFGLLHGVVKCALWVPGAELCRLRDISL